LGSSGGLGSSLGLSSSSSTSSSRGLGSSFGASSSSGSASSSNSVSSGSSSSSGSAQDLVIFTRAGWSNPAGVQRPGLERVSYRLQDGKLRRMHWAELDVTEASAPMPRDLLDHVKSVWFRYLTDARTWSDQWPASGQAVADPNSLRMRPLAIEVTLELEDWGRIVRIIEVPT
jgi:general secretion pathway protein J